jgi:hemolysin activation/secretion protein
MWFRAIRVMLGSAALLASAAVAEAQVAPIVPPSTATDQTLRKQQQIENAQPNPQTSPQESPVIGPGFATAPHPKGKGASFVLQGVTFDSSRFLSRAELDAIAAPYIGHTVDFSDLAAILDKINALYKDNGQITARAILPPQKIAGGVVHISLIEGKVGKVVITGNTRTSSAFVGERIILTSGEVVDEPALSRDVVFFNRTNDAQVRALLKPGAAFGETDIDLLVTDPPANVTQLFVDNEGVDSTGRGEGGIFYRHSDLIADDDRVTFYGTLSGGGFDGSASYTLPVDTDGDRLTFNYDRNHINVINGPVGSLSITGHGQTGSVGVTRPLVATEDWLVSTSLNATVDTSSTSEPAGIVADTTTYRGIAGMSATYISQDLMVSLSPNVAYAHSDNAILHTERSLAIVTGTGVALWRLDQDWSAHFQTGWQYTPDALLPADQLFQVGGPTSVRGYRAGLLAGDSGYYVNAELHNAVVQLPSGALDVYAFADNGAAFSTKPAWRSVTSLGVGTSVPLLHNMTLNASVGAPIEHVVSGQAGCEVYIQLVARL